MNSLIERSGSGEGLTDQQRYPLPPHMSIRHKAKKNNKQNGQTKKERNQKIDGQTNKSSLSIH